MTIETIGDIADVSLSALQTADDSRAQMLAAVGHPAGVIEREANVTASQAQMYERQHNGS